jgi:hypothetical protein
MGAYDFKIKIHKSQRRPLRVRPRFFLFSFLFMVTVWACKSFSQTPSLSLDSNLMRAKQSLTSDSTSQNLKYDFLGSLGGNFYGDEKQQEQSVALSAYTKTKYKPISFAEFDLFAGLNLFSGHSQYRYGDSAPHSGLDLKEAAVNFSVLEHFKIGLGALSVNEYPSSTLMISNHAFPGVKEEILFGTKHQHVLAFAEQMIPTSSSLSTQTADQEVTPSFFQEGIDLRTPFFTRDLLVGAYVGHFQFTNLPGAVANQSALYGNSVRETGPSSSKFKYDFNGVFAGADSEYRFSRSFKLGVSQALIQNIAAPEGSNLGAETAIRACFCGASEYTVSIQATSFFNESDSSPAFFNSAEYGHNNMQGYSGGIKIDFPKQRFYARADYYNASLINKNPDQYDQQIIYIRFVTEYGNTKLFD